jgi:hypothetical protein
MKTFKHIPLLMAMIIAIFMGSCQKEPLSPVSNTNSSSISRAPNQVGYCGNVTVTELIAGQTINAGQVIVSNNGETLYVTYKTNEAWTINEMHLYVGDLRLLPKTESGNPKPGQFPYIKKLTGSEFEYTFAIPLSEIGHCFVVAAHATLISRLPAQSAIIETAWGNGLPINNEEGNWGMYFDVCKQLCGDYEL